jgi:hypothetical protein
MNFGFKEKFGCLPLKNTIGVGICEELALGYLPNDLIYSVTFEKYKNKIHNIASLTGFCTTVFSLHLFIIK